MPFSSSGSSETERGFLVNGNGENTNGHGVVISDSYVDLQGNGDSTTSAQTLSTLQKTNVFIQIFLLITAQALKQFFYANSLPSELLRLNLISAAASESEDWKAFVWSDVVCRTFLVMMSRIPSVLYDAKHPHKDEKITNEKAFDLLPKDGKHDGEYPTSVDQNATFFTKTKRKIAYNVGMWSGYLDGCFAIPATTFYAWHLLTQNKASPSVLAQSLAAAGGSILGVYGAKTYISYRVPGSVARMYVLLKQMYSQGLSNTPGLNKKKFYASLAVSIWVGFTAGVYLFFSGYKMMDSLFNLCCEHAEDAKYWQDRIGVPVAALGALAVANTNVCNMMTALWGQYMSPKASHNPSDYKPVVSPNGSLQVSNDSGQSREDASQRRHRILKATTYTLGGISVSVDWALSAMTFMFLLGKLKWSDPADSSDVARAIPICFVLLIPSTARSALYTVYLKAVKRGLPMLGKTVDCLFDACGRGRQGQDGASGYQPLSGSTSYSVN